MSDTITVTFKRSDVDADVVDALHRAISSTEAIDIAERAQLAGIADSIAQAVRADEGSGA